MDAEGTPTGSGSSSDNQLLGLILKGIDELRADMKDMREQFLAGDDKRLSKEAFLEYQKATDGRLDRLEASPMKVLAWLSFAAAFLGPLLTIILFIIVHK